MRIRPRTLLLLVASALTIVIAIVTIIITRPSAPGTRASESTASNSANAATGGDAGTHDAGPSVQDLLSARLSTHGAQLSAGLPATLVMEDIDGGKTVYVNVTMNELTQLPTSQAQQLAAERKSLAGDTVAYTMPVTLSVIGIIDADGEQTTSHAVLTTAELNRFRIATHPGSDPLTSTASMSSPGCAGAPSRVSINTHQKLTWCIHGFAADESNPPTGGHYQTESGAYTNPITWASKTFAAPTIP